MIACLLGHVDMVKFLAGELKADIHAVDQVQSPSLKLEIFPSNTNTHSFPISQDGASALFYASTGGNLEIVRYLVEGDNDHLCPDVDMVDKVSTLLS